VNGLHRFGLASWALLVVACQPAVSHNVTPAHTVRHIATHVDVALVGRKLVVEVPNVSGGCVRESPLDVRVRSQTADALVVDVGEYSITYPAQDPTQPMLCTADIRGAEGSVTLDERWLVNGAATHTLVIVVGGTENRVRLDVDARALTIALVPQQMPNARFSMLQGLGLTTGVPDVPSWRATIAPDATTTSR
jgi:hypothetical protein